MIDFLRECCSFLLLDWGVLVGLHCTFLLSIVSLILDSSRYLLLHS